MQGIRHRSVCKYFRTAFFMYRFSPASPISFLNEWSMTHIFFSLQKWFSEIIKESIILLFPLTSRTKNLDFRISPHLSQTDMKDRKDVSPVITPCYPGMNSTYSVSRTDLFYYFPLVSSLSITIASVRVFEAFLGSFQTVLPVGGGRGRLGFLVGLFFLPGPRYYYVFF